MNKGQLIEVLSTRLGENKRVTADAVDAMLDIIVRNVSKGENVTITGFGVFEKRARAARTARNPRTGEAVRIRKTTVPNFRPGTLFKEVIEGSRKLPRASAATTTAKPAARTTTARPTTTTRATTTRTAAAKAKAAPKRAATTRTTTAKKAAAKTTRPAAKKAAAKSTRPAAKKATTAKKATAKTARPAAKKATATKRGNKR